MAPDARTATTPAPRVEDRRVRRSRRAIQEALVLLALEEGYGALTVEGLIQRADVSRATFYAHFSDMDQLLRSMVTDLIADLIAAAATSAPTGENAVANGAGISILCRHADQHRDLYRVVLSGAGNGQGRAAYTDALTAGVMRVFTPLVAANHGIPRMPLDAAARSWAGSFASLLDWWLFEHPEHSAEEVTSIGVALLIAGFMWAIGAEHGIELDPAIVADLEARAIDGLGA